MSVRILVADRPGREQPRGDGMDIREVRDDGDRMKQDETPRRQFTSRNYAESVPCCRAQSLILHESGRWQHLFWRACSRNSVAGGILRAARAVPQPSRTLARSECFVEIVMSGC